MKLNTKYKILNTKKILTLTILALCTGIFLWFFTNPASAAWWDDSWTFRKSIALTNNTTAETNVYVSVTINTTDTSRFQTDCGDVRFTKQNGELLPYYIVSGCGGASTVIHVNFDTFPAGAQTIYYYYGNLSASDGFNLADFATQASNYTVGSLGSEEKSVGPVAYWGFDEGQGQTTQDSSTNNYDGTLGATTGSSTDDPTWQTEDMCISGKCLKFDGGDYVSGGDVNQVDNVSAITVSAWVKVNTATNWAGVMGKSSSGTSRWGMELAEASYGGTDDVFIMMGNGANSYGYTQGNIIDTNKWHLWTMVFDGTQSGNANRLKFYLDGIQRPLNFGGTTIPATTPSNSTPITIGAENASSSFLNGMIDEPKVYNYAKTAAQIKADYISKSGSSSDQGSSAVLGASSQKYLSDGLVGYWKMNEASWTNNCSAASVTDSSGNGNNGKACPNATGPTGGNIGTFGNGGSFDAVDDNIAVTHASSLSLTDSITISTWVKVTLNNSWSDHVILYKQNGATLNYAFGIREQNGLFPDFAYTDGSGSNNHKWRSTTAISADTWTHITVTYSFGKANTMAIYINGVPASGSWISGNGNSSADTTTTDLLISPGNSTLDDLRIYNKTLSPKEVSDLYNFAPGPVGYWNMDDKVSGDSKTVVDSSGNGNNGTTSYGANTSGMDCSKSGKFGGGCTFDGVDDYIDVGSDTSLDNLPNGDFTAEAWTRFDAALTETYWLILGKTKWQIEPFYNGAQSSIWFFVDMGAGTSMDYRCQFTYDRGNWHHITGVYTASTKTAVVYYDGTPLTCSTTTAGVGTYIGDAASPMRIGMNQGDGTPKMNGGLDDVKVYNYARTQKQIISDMNAGHPAVGSPVGSALGYWKFDEGADNKCSGGTNDVCNSGSAGSALDGAESNMSIPATTTSGWTNSGKFGKALIFDGSNDFISVANNAALNFDTGSFSISTWMKTTFSGAGEKILIRKDLESQSPRRLYTLFYNLVANKATFDLYDNATEYKATSLTSVNDGNWHHIVGVRDSTTNQIKLYVDGKLEASTAITGINITNTGVLKFGSYTETVGAFFSGSIDESKIYGYALTADEVKTEYNRGQSMVLGAAGNNSSYASQAANQEYCVPGDTTSCVAPVAEWKLEEGSGISAYDTSGNGSTGTLTNTPVWTNGKYGKALNFSGTSFINVTDSNNLSPASNTFSVGAWIYLNSTGSYQTIVSKDSDAANGGREYFLYIDISNVVVFGASTNGNDMPAVVGLSTLSAGRWYYIEAVLSGSNQMIYVNGKLDNSANWGGSSIPNTNTALNIGRRNTAPVTKAQMDGKIDDVRLYNYAHTPAQIAWDYNKGAPIGHWKFNECQGATANDSSGNSNTGTITIGTGAGTGQQDSVGTCTTSAVTAWYNGRTGKRNSSLNFDGIDDTVSIANQANFSFERTQPFSISGWIYPNITRSGLQMTYAIFSKLTNNSPFTGYEMNLEWNNATLTNRTTLQIYLISSWPSNRITVNGSTDLQNSRWYHATLTYDGSSAASGVKLYINGAAEKITTSVDALTTSIVNNLTPYIASRQNSNSSEALFNGQIDDVKVFNYTLTSTQVKDLYNGGAVNFGPVTGSP
ncbi:MAG: DUF2341 domain-containing protein [Candidatus Daviesbacteria bacterium]|nr:DUF2341 domain-containing protein [Candidatus Daviesbacteria bacterium]